MTGEITQLLEKWTAGDGEALGKIMTLLYDDLRVAAVRYMRGERPGHTLQATALVHEAYEKIGSFRHVPWKNRSHFIGVFVKEMRRVVIDYARRHCAEKRGGGVAHDDIADVPLPDGSLSILDLMVIDEALGRLEMLNEQQSRIFDARFFAGLTIEDTATYLGISKATVERGYAGAKAFLSHELDVSKTSL